ncbi:hypothetical protein [Halomonas cibimaris]|uniref:hypothetical protein n=1 Tax=Halomonas cibimaris TaxID=657012 RepID=UPI0031D4D5A8
MLTTAILESLGFITRKGGVHSSRTIMLDELLTLFEHVPADAAPTDYRIAICEYNCLGKRSGRTRQLTARHLAELYGLDPDNPVSAGLRYFWSRDEAARPMLALLASMARDSLLRDTVSIILANPCGTSIARVWLEEQIETLWPNRFSPATRKSSAQNINSSLTKSGHLQGRSKKIRRQPPVTPGAVAYALYLSWLQGDRGELLLRSLYCRLLEAGDERVLELAAQASAKGWIVMRHIDNVIDVAFPAQNSVVERALTYGDATPAFQQDSSHE